MSDSELIRSVEVEMAERIKLVFEIGATLTGHYIILCYKWIAVSPKTFSTTFPETRDFTGFRLFVHASDSCR